MQRAITIYWPNVQGEMVSIRCEDGQAGRVYLANGPVSDWRVNGDDVVLRSEHHEVHLSRWMYHERLGIDPTPARERASTQRRIDDRAFRG